MAQFTIIVIRNKVGYLSVRERVLALTVLAMSVSLLPVEVTLCPQTSIDRAPSWQFSINSSVKLILKSFTKKNNMYKNPKLHESLCSRYTRKAKPINLAPVKKFTSLLKISMFYYFFYKQVHHTKVCLHYPHLFVLEFDHHCVTCRVLALHHVWVDLGRDYHRILLTPERVLTEHKVGHGRGEAFSWEDRQLKRNKYCFNVCKSTNSLNLNHFWKKQIHFVKLFNLINQ